MIRRPPRSTLDRSSAASDVYKRQELYNAGSKTVDLGGYRLVLNGLTQRLKPGLSIAPKDVCVLWCDRASDLGADHVDPVSYTHLRAHETVLDLVCRLLLEKKK